MIQLRRRGACLEAHAPAKLNLFLEVLGKRSDGFHEIETLMVPISLFDTLVFEATFGQGIELECMQVPVRAAVPLGETNTLPEGSDNIIVRAVRLLAERAGLNRGARIRLRKRIPLAAGLAGGSSDAAAALLAANESWSLHWPRERLAGLAAELGSDVPFFLGYGPAVCRGRGERIEPAPVLGNAYFVVARPPVGLSTADVYRRCQAATSPRSVAALAQALAAGRWSAAGRLLHNRLQSAAEELEPWVGRLAREFSRIDCLGHQMSGSGTAYFGLCRNSRHARRAASVLRSRGVGHVYAAGSACAGFKE